MTRTARSTSAGRWRRPGRFIAEQHQSTCEDYTQARPIGLCRMAHLDVMSTFEMGWVADMPLSSFPRDAQILLLSAAA